MTPLGCHPRRSGRCAASSMTASFCLACCGARTSSCCMVAWSERVRRESLTSTSVTRLNKLLVRALGDRAEVRVQAPFGASDVSEPEPDLAVVPPGSYLDEHPSRAHLLIEVADSSLQDDRRIKGPLYAAAGVPEYWIVDLVRGA